MEVRLKRARADILKLRARVAGSVAVGFEIGRRALDRVERLVLLDTTASADTPARRAGRLADIVKVTTFLSDRAYAAENSAIRREVLASLTPALTIIIAGIYDPAWLLEIEAIAAREKEGSL